MPTDIGTTGNPEPVGPSVLLNGRYLPPPKDGDGKLWIRATVLVQRGAEDLYALWRQVESAIEWRGHVSGVRQIDVNVYRWTMRNGDETAEWDTEIMADEPGKRIAWRTISGDLEEAGEVIFEPAIGGRGTIASVLQEYRMGKLESFWRTLTERNPKQGVLESLRRFKAMAECGEIPRTEGQPHGPRGMAAKMKRASYGENLPIPPQAARKAS
jgi:uncharacterized membrane protein